MRVLWRSWIVKRACSMIVIAAGALALSACTSIPAQPLQSYLATFKQARDASEEVILRARAEAQWVATTPLNTRDPATRAADLKDRLAALDAYFVCLEVIDRYNDVLVGLATPGRGQAAIQSDIEQLSSTLAMLDRAGLNKLVERVPVYGPIIAQAIEIIDDLIRKRQFAAAARAAAGPVRTLTTLLSENTRLMSEIASLRSELELFDIEVQMDSLHNDVVEGLKGWRIASELDSDVALSAAAGRFASAAKRVHAQYGAIAAPGGGGGAAPGTTPPDLAAVSAWLDQQAQRAEQLARQQDEALTRKAAFERVAGETAELFAASGNTFVALNRAIEESRVEATVDLGIRVMRLREALRALDAAEKQAR